LPDFVREPSPEVPEIPEDLTISKPNLVQGGGKVTFLPGFVYYKPHNYRLYFDFSKEGFSLLKPRLTKVQDKPQVKIINRTEYFIDGFEGCSFKVRKRTVEVINKRNPGRLFKLVLGDIDLMRQQARDILDFLSAEGVGALKLFLEAFGGSSSLQFYKRKAEHKFFGEAGINRIPLKMVFQNEIVKHVYKEKELEFFSEDQALNYFSNRAFEEVAPQVAQEIKSLKDSVAGLVSLRSAGFPCVPPDSAPWAVWSDYFFKNRERLGLDYSRVRWLT
jgi:hypothetical protein